MRPRLAVCGGYGRRGKRGREVTYSVKGKKREMRPRWLFSVMVMNEDRVCIVRGIEGNAAALGRFRF